MVTTTGIRPHTLPRVPEGRRKELRRVNQCPNYAMPSTHLAFHLHVVFSTKEREQWLAPSLRPRVHEYMGGILNAEGVFPHIIGGMGDHVHALISLRATHCLADVVQRLKSVSSRWIHEEHRLAGFA